MEIILSENLRIHFADFAIDQYSNIDRILEHAHLMQHRPPDWIKIRQVAYLVADEVREWRPNFRDLAKRTGQYSIGIGRLQREITGFHTEPKPWLLFDPDERKKFILEELKTSHIDTKHPDQVLEELSITEDFVKMLTPSSRTSPSSGIFISNDPILNRCYLENLDYLSSDSILAILAVSGINIDLPAIFPSDSETVQTIKEKFGEERQIFIDSLRGFIKDCHEGLKNGLYRDIYEYADKATNQTLIAQVNAFERAVSKADQKLLKSVKVGILEGIPSIGAALLDPKKSALQQTGVEILRIFCQTLTEKSAVRKASLDYPLASYVYRLRRVDPKSTSS